MAMIWIGLVLGLTNGLSPGPTMALLISQTLSKGLKNGVAIACSPLIFGIIIIPVVTIFAHTIKNINPFLTLISLAGAVYLFKMAYQHIKLSEHLQLNNKQTVDLKTILFINFFSPYPYIFWFTTGLSIISSAAQDNSHMRLLAFIASYYISIIGSKIILAVIVRQFGNILNNRVYDALMRVLGVLIFLIGMLVLFDSYKYLLKSISF